MVAPHKTDFYIFDLGKELITLAKSAQQEANFTQDIFQRGRQMAIYEVLSLMKEQAAAFGIAERTIGLEGINIENLLT